MHIEKKLFKAAFLIFVLSIVYYLFYAWNENKLSAYCQKYVCFEILSYSEFLTFLLGSISLYFILRSLESWKNAYKFERAMIAIKKFDELNLTANRYYTFLWQLNNQLKKKKEKRI